MIATIHTIVSGTPTHAGQRVDAEQREREAVDPDAEPHRHRCREQLTAELLEPAKAAKVVDRSDGDGDRRAEQQPARVAAEREEGERGHEDAEEERETAEARDRVSVQAPPAGAVDDAQHSRHPADRRREQHDDDERDDRTPEDFEVIAEHVDDAVLRRYAEHCATLALLAVDPPERHDSTMVAAQPVHGVETRVVAVSRAHAPYRDGRFERGDAIEVSIRDTTMPPADSLAYRVCITFPKLYDTRCQHATLDCFWPGDPVRFANAANGAAIVRWYNRSNLIAQRKLRLVR